MTGGRTLSIIAVVETGILSREELVSVQFRAQPSRIPSYHLWMGTCRVFEIGINGLLRVKVVGLSHQMDQSLSRQHGIKAFLTFRKLIACSRVVLVKLTKLTMASSGGSEAMLAR